MADRVETGSATIEAALVIPVVLLVLVAVVELISLAATRLELVAAAREGARVAATTPDPAAAVAAAREVLGDGPATISVVRPAVVGRPAEVVVSVDRPLVTPLLDVFTVPIRARAVMRVER